MSMIREYKENRRKKILWHIAGTVSLTLLIFAMLYNSLSIEGWPAYIFMFVAFLCILLIVYFIRCSKIQLSIQLYPKELFILDRGKVHHRIPLDSSVEIFVDNRRRAVHQVIRVGDKNIYLDYFLRADFLSLRDEVNRLVSDMPPAKSKT